MGKKLEKVRGIFPNGKFQEILKIFQPFFLEHIKFSSFCINFVLENIFQDFLEIVISFTS